MYILCLHIKVEYGVITLCFCYEIEHTMYVLGYDRFVVILAATVGSRQTHKGACLSRGF